MRGAAAMGQVLGFAHCKEAPSTASTTPDSTEGGPEDPPPFPEPPEDEDDDDDDDEENEEGAALRCRPSPHELTFSYIAFGGGGGSRPSPTPEPGGGRGLGGPDPSPTPQKDPRPKKEPGDPEPPPRNRGGASPAPLPSPPPGGARPEPPRASAPPPPPSPDQSPAAAGADGQVWELLLWRVPHRSALALLVSLLLLGSLSRFSAVAVAAHAALAVLAVTVPLRLRRAALRALRAPGTEPLASVPSLSPPTEPQTRAQPWSLTEEQQRRWARIDLHPPLPRPLTEEQQRRWARCLARHSVAAARTLTRLFLVHSVPESLKFAFLFYLLTYVGAACNGVTLLAAGVISAFTFPVLYRRHQAQIDQYLSLARGHLSHLRARVLAKLPSAKVKPQ
ncbi:reticulon-2-like [Melozone crissalis]|uniref:reticulon-2-like n=1 Tax=Melozone crissalis TaxID=40204 RepID=UPI0023DA06BD|nr:reticulon-2-like [Melozone crissalis]